MNENSETEWGAGRITRTDMLKELQDSRHRLGFGYYWAFGKNVFNDNDIDKLIPVGVF